VAALPARAQGEALVVVQLIALIAYLWYLNPVLLALGNFALPTVFAGDLRELRPSNYDVHEQWRALATWQLLVFGGAWYAMLRARRLSRERGGIASVAGGAALLMLTALLFAIPFRVFYHAELERVMLGAERCYEAARQPAEILVFCPERPAARSSAVSLSDPTLRRTGTIESVFAVFDDAASATAGRSPQGASTR
jgi:hypothetical protein